MDQLGGNSVEIGFASAAYTGYIIETLTENLNADIKEIRGEDNEIYTKLRSNKREEVSFDMIIKTGSAIAPLQAGDAVALTLADGVSVTMMVVSSTASFQREETKLSIQAVKEPALTYT